ncbi:beta-arrestin-1-like isoform X1 [Apostichopus japonicus]|uniref:beta-arrestin-1-like isoform X1 n=1 Tax=Stichopus japonicus TaxID=307972 RepID=UPI003AB8E112
MSESDKGENYKSEENEEDKDGPASNGVSGDSKKSGTRVFKKSSPNGKITTYLGKRDFVDHLEYIDPIDGVVLVDPEYLKDRKVYAHVLAAFRYGREDLDVLGLTFRKDLLLQTMQVYPSDPDAEKPLTKLQERLIKKLGKNAFPFFFQLPKHAPNSVTLQPAPGDTGKPCGVDYELKTYVADSVNEKPHKRNSVRLAIRKVTYAAEVPDEKKIQPQADKNMEFMMSRFPLHLEATLDKQQYYHGEDIAVNVHIANNSKKSVKKIRISVRQLADICLFSSAQYKCPVAVLETEEGMPVGPSQTLSRVYKVTPLLTNNKDKRGLALDGKLKHEDTNLASSTVLTDLDENGKIADERRENLGIIVEYRVKVELKVAYSTTNISVELPFKLSHPKPEDTELLPPVIIQQPADGETAPLDTNLISFETNEQKLHGDEDDDLIFEDFARLRLQGAEGEGTEA